MGIPEDILATTPYLYWKLDDSTGPAASDSSGNSRPGVYVGTFSLRQRGPEPGTYAAQFGAGGGVQPVSALSAVSTADFSFAYYLTFPVAGSSTLVNVGQFGNASSRGVAIQQNLNGNAQAHRFNTSTGANTASAFLSGWGAWWHHYAVTWVQSTGTLQYFCDGASIGGIGGGTTVGSPPDAFGVICPYQGVLCHVAFWNRVLTGVEVSAIANHIPTWPYGPPTSYLPQPGTGGGAVELDPADPVVVDLNTDLSDIRRAVLHDYTTGPP